MATNSPKPPASELELPAGIERHGNWLRIVFRFRNVRCRELLPNVEVTKSNIKWADRKRSAILHEISQGTFDYKAHFPGSAMVERFSATAPVERRTVDQALDKYLLVAEARHAHSTVTNYRRKANKHIRPRWGAIELAKVIKTDIDVWLTVELAQLNNKTINEILIPMRAIFQDALADRIIGASPLDGIENLTLDGNEEEPDPFTRSEIARFSEAPTTRQQEVRMIVFNCWAGLRISELIALAWEDIDLKAGTVMVRRACVMGRWKSPKTKGSIRVVELLAPALALLREQMATTYALPAQPLEVLGRDNKSKTVEQLRIVFLNSNTGQPFTNDMQVRDRFWKAHMGRAGIRYRGPGQSRHTYGSQMLTINMPLEWVARQMGHTSTKMLKKHYAKWVREDAPNMAGMASKLLASEDFEKAPIEPQKEKQPR